jgi:hypothetical protein
VLSQLKQLSLDIDGRYASDAELEFLVTYAKTFPMRFKTYQTIQGLEDAIVQQASSTLQARHPQVFLQGGENLAVKWKRDTMRVLRYSAVAMLMDDPTTLRECFLLWFQTIMRAFGAQKSCDATYEIMQQVVKQKLQPDEALLFCPILELNRQTLGQHI